MKEKFDNFYSDCDYDHRGDCDREYGLYSDFESEVWILLAAIQDDFISYLNSISLNSDWIQLKLLSHLLFSMCRLCFSAAKQSPGSHAFYSMIFFHFQIDSSFRILLFVEALQ